MAGTPVFGSPALSNIESVLIPNLSTRADQIRDEINTAVAADPSRKNHTAVNQAVAAHNAVVKAVQALRGVVLHNEDDYST